MKSDGLGREHHVATNLSPTGRVWIDFSRLRAISSKPNRVLALVPARSWQLPPVAAKELVVFPTRAVPNAPIEW